MGKWGERDTEEILRVTGTFLEKMLEATVCVPALWLVHRHPPHLVPVINSKYSLTPISQ